MTGNAFSLPITYVYGQNTIEVTAIDLATNRSTAKRTVTFDNVNPSLAVTNPAQDLATNQASIALTGTVDDLTSTTVAVTVDGTTYTPAVTNGAIPAAVHVHRAEDLRRRRDGHGRRGEPDHGPAKHHLRHNAPKCFPESRDHPDEPAKPDLERDHGGQRDHKRHLLERHARPDRLPDGHDVADDSLRHD